MTTSYEFCLIAYAFNAHSLLNISKCEFRLYGRIYNCNISLYVFKCQGCRLVRIVNIISLPGIFYAENPLSLSNLWYRPPYSSLKLKKPDCLTLYYYKEIIFILHQFRIFMIQLNWLFSWQ